MAGLVFAGATGLVPPGPADALSTPQELLVYYGWPSHINGAGSPAAAAAELGRYDYVVLGAGAEDPAHPDHARTVAILADPAMEGTFVFGYVNLGVTNGFLAMDEVQRRIGNWQAAGADAVMLDAYGYDFGVTRERQNEAVGYAHSLDMPVMANAWFPADAFGAVVDPDHNPDGTPALLGSTDYYLSESYRIRDGEYVAESLWRAKAADLAGYRAQTGFSVFSLTTNDPANAYVEEMFFAAWRSAAEDGHLAIGWGEYLFSATDGLAPYRARPAATEPLPPPEPPPVGSPSGAVLPATDLAADPGESDPPADPGSDEEPTVPPDEAGAPVAASCGGRSATLVGTTGDDLLVGSDGPDVIAGLGGNDVIDGRGGDDLVCGGAGNDYIVGGGGNDRLIGGVGSDELRGDAGDDTLRGEGGNDRLAGGDGDDRLFGGGGADVLYADTGDDLLVGQRGEDLLDGADGFDRARGGPQADRCDAERTLACER